MLTVDGARRRHTLDPLALVKVVSNAKRSLVCHRRFSCQLALIGIVSIGWIARGIWVASHGTRIDVNLFVTFQPLLDYAEQDPGVDAVGQTLERLILVEIVVVCWGLFEADAGRIGISVRSHVRLQGVYVVCHFAASQDWFEFFGSC